MSTPLATDRQLDFIATLAAEKNAVGLDLETSALTRDDASALITDLLRRPAAGEPVPEIDEAEYTRCLTAYLENIPTHLTYTRPHPELKGSDRVEETCSRCHGSGLFANVAPELDSLTGERALPPHWEIDGRGDNAWCFRCEGTGRQTVLVSSVRARERRNVKDHNDVVDTLRKDAARTIRQRLEDAARAAAEEEAAEEGTAALSRLYPEDARLVDVGVTVTRAGTFDRPDYRGVPETVRAVTFTTTAGDDLVWVSAAASAFKVTVESAGILSAVVKRVTTYRNRPQVQIIRARFTPAPPVERVSL